MRSSSCRNISRIPRLSVNHCYPLRNQEGMEVLLAPIMEKIIKAFIRLSPSLNESFPSILLFPGELQWPELFESDD
jgi:hypothetical protein